MSANLTLPAGEVNSLLHASHTEALLNLYNPEFISSLGPSSETIVRTIRAIVEEGSNKEKLAAIKLWISHTEKALRLGGQLAEITSQHSTDKRGRVTVTQRASILKIVEKPNVKAPTGRISPPLSSVLDPEALSAVLAAQSAATSAPVTPGLPPPADPPPPPQDGPPQVPQDDAGGPAPLAPQQHLPASHSPFLDPLRPPHHTP